MVKSGNASYPISAMNTGRGAKRSGLQQKPRVNEEDSSLLQILDSWHSSKEGKDKTDNSENYEGLVDCSEYNVKPSGAAGEGTKIY
ncbi:hypothetical protein Goshw_023309 [Gossypium schwendimanii]|uniref:Uncharacterized protein n=1 Tax=Gossypium schwendimanii TaxID=34291 RepID=A0A7J9LQR4_GOSSC|nr:hypothetical protein [Gossypium schwendimanii]